MIALRVRDAIAHAFGPALAETDPLLRPTQDARFGDLQANVAMGLGKRLGQKPREVAQAIVDKLDLAETAGRPEIAGPGFINLRLDDRFLARLADEAARDLERLGVARVSSPETVVV